MTGGVRFHLFNTAGRLAWHAGKGLRRFGLVLCGWSGWLDATADSYAD